VEDFEERTDRMIEHLGLLLESIKPLVDDEPTQEAASNDNGIPPTSSTTPPSSATIAEVSKNVKAATEAIENGMKSLDRKSSIMVDILRENDARTMKITKEFENMQKKQASHENLIVQMLKDNDEQMRKLQQEVRDLQTRLGVAATTTTPKSSSNVGTTPTTTGTKTGGVKKETPYVFKSFDPVSTPLTTATESNFFSSPHNKAQTDLSDVSDNYVSRIYPTVPKTPGTMFVTELTELLELEVGHHALLAEIMDSQWGIMKSP